MRRLHYARGLTREVVARLQVHLLDWYSVHGRDFPWRRSKLGCYERIVAELLLQRTRAETVASFLPGFLSRFPSWQELARAPRQELENALKPVGLWQRRACSLRLLSAEMVNRKGVFPRERKEIEGLPGIGQYVANAVELFCHGVPRPLLDANMARVLERIFGPRKLVDIRYDPYLQELAAAVVLCESPWEVNWAILDLAAMVCKKKVPLCNGCPVSSQCTEWSSGRNAVPAIRLNGKG